MAITRGHGNPKWTREEVMLALALYFEVGKVALSSKDPRVTSLSKLLNELPFHDQTTRKGSFRNPDGVAFKLQNLHFLNTGDGLANTSQTDRSVWDSYGTQPNLLMGYAVQIKRGIEFVKSSQFPLDTEEGEEFFEGKTLTELHRRIERSSALRKKFIDLRRRQNKMICDICGIIAKSGDHALFDAIFEAHHIIPISQIGIRGRRLSDLSLLCANCHRCVHRLISLNGEWLSISDCKILMGYA